MKSMLLFALCLMMSALTLWGQTNAIPLFTIERSKNANVVQYDAHLTAAGAFDPVAPVSAYWIMLAKDGRREELNFVERRKAYGFEIAPNIVTTGATNSLTMTIVAYKDRQITVKKVGQKVWPEIMIAGRPAVFQKMYISSTEGLVLPTVNYIELFGKDLESGAALSEKISPK